VIVVTGATGNVGRPLVRRLAGAGISVRAISRDLGKARALRLPESDLAVGDLNEPAFREKALAGAEKVFLLLGGGDPFGILTSAARAGVARVVLVTSLNTECCPDGAVGRGSLAVERHMARCGLAGTVLRPWEFASNAAVLAAEIHRTGAVRVPVGSMPSPVIDPADVASVAMTVLTEDGHDGKTYSLTGPAEITAAEKVRIVGRALGRNLGFGEYRDPRQEEMISAEPDQMSGVFGVCYVPGPGVLSTVEDLTGRPAGTFEGWVTDNVACFDNPLVRV
jgi:uncharacterized protein YbjT (DUF2867 family)